MDRLGSILTTFGVAAGVVVGGLVMLPFLLLAGWCFTVADEWRKGVLHELDR